MGAAWSVCIGSAPYGEHFIVEPTGDKQVQITVGWDEKSDVLFKLSLERAAHLCSALAAAIREGQ